MYFHFIPFSVAATPMNDMLFIVLANATNSDQFLFRSDKIYTVLTVILIIWCGIVFHFFWLNRKVKKIEHRIEEQIRAKAEKTPSNLHPNQSA
jgi:CcmD family protein